MKCIEWFSAPHAVRHINAALICIVGQREWQLVEHISTRCSYNRTRREYTPIRIVRGCIQLKPFTTHKSCYKKAKGVKKNFLHLSRDHF